MYSRRIQEKVKRDYDEIAGEFAESRQFPWKEFDLFLKYYRKDFKVLDLGCGNGRLLRWLSKHEFGSYLGVDQSKNLLEIAKKEHPEQKFLLGDMTDLEGKIATGSLDVIFAIASFHHVPPRLQEKTLKSWKKLLKPGGYIFMTNWNLHQPRFWPLLLRSLIIPVYGFRGLLIPWKKSVKRYYFAFTKRRLEKLMRKAGFEVLEMKSGKNIVTVAKLSPNR
jgi:SAM-dependent methyltransferase